MDDNNTMEFYISVKILSNRYKTKMNCIDFASGDVPNYVALDGKLPSIVLNSLKLRGYRTTVNEYVKSLITS